MMRNLVIALAVAAAAGLAFPVSASSASAHPKRAVVRHWHGYGFLPGSRSPERIEWEDYVARARRGPQYWYGYPRFYRGRWNGGGFGPCWTQTPIGPIWNCGQ
jgi:hypothetical protein